MRLSNGEYFKDFKIFDLAWIWWIWLELPWRSVPKIIICYSVSDIWCVTCNFFFFSFWAIFFPFTPLTAWKIEIWQKWKKHLETSSFFTSVPKIMITWCTVTEIWCVTDWQTTSRQSDRKSDIKRGVPHIKTVHNTYNFS